jgi:branched-chain amino acid transport system ATP-binding protein
VTTMSPTEPVQQSDQDALLTAEGVSFGYGSIPVVRDLRLNVRAGEVVSMLGANGAGKTTTLLGLAGELKASGGTVRWLGKAVHSSLNVRAKEGLALVPGDRGVISKLSVKDNLRLGLGDPDYAIELFPELRPLLKRSAGLLSGGEQKILMLARALGARPRLLLADELSLGLAPLIVQRLLEAVRQAADSGVGVLLVEQQVRMALDICDRAYVMRRGRVVMDGTREDLSDMMGIIEGHYLDSSTPSDG